MLYIFILVFIVVIVAQWVRVFDQGKEMINQHKKETSSIDLAEKHFQKAQFYMSNGFNDLAIEFFQKAQNSSPNNQKYIKGLQEGIDVISNKLFMQAKVYFNNKNVEDAFKLLKRAHEINPKNTEYYNAYIKLGKALNKNVF